MSIQNDQKPRIVQVAERIEQDIRDRGLEPGDTYFTTAEIAQMLGINTATANRALQLLAQRGLLDRRRRAGTRIARVEESDKRAVIERVRLVVNRDYLRREGLLADGVIVGLERVLPGSSIQLNFLPVEEQEQYVEELLRETMSSDQAVGFVLVRSSLSAQRLLGESGLPTVINGSPYPSITSLPWIDRDQYASGRLLAEHVLGRGHRRAIVLLRERMFPGDHAFMDGVRDAMAAERLGAGSIIYRDLPVDKAAVTAELQSLLKEMGKQLPAVIARSEPLGELAAEAVKAAGLRVGPDVAVTIAQVYRRGNENPPPFPYIMTRMSPIEQGEKIAELLVDRAGDPFSEAKHHLIPVELVVPEEAE